MRRSYHGPSAHPPLSRPGSGYGRHPGRPGPDIRAVRAARDHRRWWRQTHKLAGVVAGDAT